MSQHPAPSPREFSHPALWTVGLVVAAGAVAWAFFHWLEVGMRHGRDAGPIDFTPKAAEQAVDHAALIADRSPAVLERGQTLYQRNCASCHGPNGDQNMTGSSPAPRNLRAEPFKAAWGGGPHGFWLTLTRGMGQGMPGFANLDAAERYAIVHFVRETWQKGTPVYVAEDAAEVAAQIPKADAAAAAAPAVPPHLVPQHERLHPLLAAAARTGTAQADEATAWIAAAASRVEPGERAVVERVRRAGAARTGWLVAVHAAARDGDRARVAALLIDPGSGDPALALVPAVSVDAVAAALVAAAQRKT